jgi:Outer membrane protein beta-barrel domain
MRLRAILSCVLVFAGASPAIAQGFTYGAKAGVNVSTLKLDPDEGEDAYSSQLGLIAGGFALRRLTGRLDLEPEGLFSMKGGSADVGSVDAKVRLDYVDVPVLLRYRIKGSDRRGIHAFGGPSFNFLVRARTISDLGGTKIEQDVTDDVERFELGVVGGVSVGFGRLMVEGRYTHGISDTDKDTDDELKIRNRMVSVLGGIRF